MTYYLIFVMMFLPPYYTTPDEFDIHQKSTYHSNSQCLIYIKNTPTFLTPFGESSTEHLSQIHIEAAGNDFLGKDDSENSYDGCYDFGHNLCFLQNEENNLFFDKDDGEKYTREIPENAGTNFTSTPRFPFNRYHAIPIIFGLMGGYQHFLQFKQNSPPGMD